MCKLLYVSLNSHGNDCSMLAFGQDMADSCSEAAILTTLSTSSLQPIKSLPTVFTSYTSKCRIELDVTVDGIKIPIINNVMLVGVTFDSLHHFTPHYHKTPVLQKVLNETLLPTCIAAGQPVKNCAASI